jgi:hypothetical protein
MSRAAKSLMIAPALGSDGVAGGRKSNSGAAHAGDSAKNQSNKRLFAAKALPMARLRIRLFTGAFRILSAPILSAPGGHRVPDGLAMRAPWGL